MKILLLGLVLLTGAAAHAGMPRPEFLLGKEEWTSLTPANQKIFLTGFVCGRGDIGGVEGLYFSYNQIPELMPLLDSFYKKTETQNIFLQDAIAICLMKLEGRAASDIEKFTQNAQQEIFYK